MPVSIFILALYIFLESATALAWFSVDPKLQGIIGIIFVVSVLIEAWFVGYRGRALLPWRAFRRND